MKHPQGVAIGTTIKAPYFRTFGPVVISEVQMEMEPNQRGFKQRVFVRAIVPSIMKKVMDLKVGDLIKVTGSFDVDLIHVLGPPEKHFANLCVMAETLSLPLSGEDSESNQPQAVEAYKEGEENV